MRVVEREARVVVAEATRELRRLTA
jgi:hypothetical protein